LFFIEKIKEWSQTTKRPSPFVRNSKLCDVFENWLTDATKMQDAVLRIQHS
jgi:hypothetical protein